MTCPRYQRLIPQGKNPRKRLRDWQKKRVYISDGVQKSAKNPQKYFYKAMNVTTTADSVMMFCMVDSIVIFDVLPNLLSMLKKGIFIDQKSILMLKTNRELRTTLLDVEKISKLNKQLINLILEK